MEKIIDELKEWLEDACLMSRPILDGKPCTEIEDKCYKMGLEYAMEIVKEVFDDNGYDIGDYFEDDDFDEE